MSELLLPDFDQVNIAELPAQLKTLLAEARNELAAIESDNSSDALATFLQRLENLDDRIGKFWSVVSHLNGVCNTDALRQAHAECLPELTAYNNELGQNRKLYGMAKALRESDITLTADQSHALDHLLRDFQLAGVALEGDKARRFSELQLQLSELSTRFQNQLLDATQAWEKIIEDKAELAGLPESILSAYAEDAAQKGMTGYRLTLDAPAYLPLMQYADNRSLRREVYEAFVTRASDQGPQAGQWDNSAVMVDILKRREEKARLLGFANYAELSLAPKMAETPQQVVSFLRELAHKARDRAREEFAELQAYAQAQGCVDLQAWDVPYYSEKLRSERYAISQEELRPYFPLATVLEGLFRLIDTLFGVTLKQDDTAPVWHGDVSCYRLYRDGDELAAIYTDLFAREQKRGGAWMADFCGRRQLGDGHQKPVAFVNCNFSQPTRERPSLLTHNDVTTLFHEFGHALHHVLTEVDVLAVAGINGVAWDAVELPSQLLENWCWQPEVIPWISAHYQTGETLPALMLERLLAAKNFQSAMFMMRQLEFALFDMLLHMQDAPASSEQIQTLLDAVREEVAVVPVPAFNRFQHGFSHIFGGGYAAGYYSYKWAEVLSSDVFSVFEEQGVLNPELGCRFLEQLLSRGGAEDPMDLFRAFRGREPSPEAMLKAAGICQ